MTERNRNSADLMAVTARDESSPAAAVRLRLVDESTPTVRERYRAEAVLKHRQGMDAWRGVDVVTNEPIAVKTLKARSPRFDAIWRDQPVGMARYVSPDQAGLLGVDVDHRSDLYSIGVVRDQRLAGTVPSHGASVSEMLRQHMTEVAPERREGDGIDRHLHLTQVRPRRVVDLQAGR